MKTIRFAPSVLYRKTIASLLSVVFLLVGIGICFTRIEVWEVAVVFVLFSLVVLVYYFFSGLRFYDIKVDGLVTRRLFTSQGTISTPYRNISQIEEYSGPIEALCNCGTVEITASSGNKIVWKHIQNADQTVNEIKSRVKNIT